MSNPVTAIGLPLAADLIRRSDAYTALRDRPEMSFIDAEPNSRRRRAMFFRHFRRLTTFKQRVDLIHALRGLYSADPWSFLV